MAVPIRPCAEAECGSEIPNWAYTYATRPEQSKPAGLSPPSWYGTPRYRAATDGTAARLKFGYGGFASNDASDGPEYAGFLTTGRMTPNDAGDTMVAARASGATSSVCGSADRSCWA